MVQKSAITVEDLYVFYNQELILDNVNFFIPAGSIAAIIGPNGAGKSTLIKSMLDFTSKKSGTVQFFANTLAEFRKKIAYIPQRAEIDWDFPITVFDLVLMGRYPYHSLFSFLKPADYKKTIEALEAVSMLAYKDEAIGNLSGGQQQRCFVARALCQEADIYLFDEPLVGIDTITEKIIMHLLKKLKNEGKTILMVHHDFSTVIEYFDWVVLLNKTVTAFGPTEQIFAQHYIQHTYKNKMVDVV